MAQRLARVIIMLMVAFMTTILSMFLTMREYASHKRNFRDGINHETIGFFLYPDRENKDKVSLPNHWNEFVELIFSNYYFSHQVQSIITSKANKYRTIRINDRGIKATDFKISAGSDKYNQLLESGKSATRKFLQEQGLYLVIDVRQGAVKAEMTV